MGGSIVLLVQVLWQEERSWRHFMLTHIVEMIAWRKKLVRTVGRVDYVMLPDSHPRIVVYSIC
jgi:hypothetical protein